MTVSNPTGAGGVTQAEIDVFVTSTTNASVSSVYTASYTGIQRCNIVLARIEPAAIDAASKKQFIGEMKFIRALLYFNLVRFYEDVPLVLEEIGSIQKGYTYARNPKDEVYAQIIKDLQDAEQKLPQVYFGSNIGCATSGAAKTLLGKVYLTIKNFPLAVSKLKEVIDVVSTGTSRLYDLAPKYSDNLDPAKSNNVGHKESIFEIQYKSGGLGEGSPWNNTSAPSGAPISLTGVGSGNGAFMWPTSDIVRAYPNGDLRLNANLDSIKQTGNTIY